MSTLEHERMLIFDRDLHRKLSAVDKKADEKAWAAATTAFNLRSMYNLAAEMAERGLKLHPHCEILWYEYIHAVTLDVGKLTDTYEKLESSKKPPPGREVLLALIDYYLERDDAGLHRLNQVPEEERGARYFEVMGHYRKAQTFFEDALELYRQAQKLSPREARLLYYIGEVYRGLGWFSHAEKWLNKAVQKEHYCVQAWNSLCRVFMEKGQMDLARQAMGHALGINPRDWGIYFSLADAFLRRGEFDRARAALHDILDMDPRVLIAAEVHNYFGYLRYLEGQFQDAIASFKKALALNPHLAVSWLNLGNLHFHLKNLMEADRCYNECLKIDPKQSSAATQLGLTHLEAGNIDKAKRPLEKALKLDSTEHWAHLGLSEYYRRKRQPTKALEHATEALTIEPDDPSVHNYLGIALEVSRKYFEAEKSYRHALQLDPTHRWAANNLGYLCEKLMRLDSSYEESAIGAWKRRLLICRDSGVSTRGAVNHLKKLGVSEKTIEKWLRTAVIPGTGRQG